MPTSRASQDAPARTKSSAIVPATVAFIGAAVSFTSLYLAAGAPTPLLVLYQDQWAFPAVILTLAFAAYSAGFLIALLTVGSLSDHLGRRPVILGALVVQLLSVVMFLFAPDIGWVTAARVVQGIATGAATSAFTATLVELAPTRRKRLATILGTVGVTGGLAVGALLTGVAIEYADDANTIVFVTIGVLTVLGIVIVAMSPETVTKKRGALRSLIPQIAVPAPARREFAAAAPVIVSIWMLAGLSLGLAPTIVRNVFQLDSGLLNGFCGFISPAVSAIIAVIFARVRPRRAIRLGIYASVIATALIVVAVLTGSLATMIGGQVVAGLGFGAAFSASLQLIFPLAATHERAGLVAAIYVVAYIAFSLPVVVSGQLAGVLGLPAAVAWYGAVTILLALISLIAQLRLAKRERD